MTTSFLVRRRADVLTFTGVDLGGGNHDAMVITETPDDALPGTRLVLVRLPGSTVWLGPGRGYRYEPVRHALYRLSNITPDGHAAATPLLTYSTRRAPKKRRRT